MSGLVKSTFAKRLAGDRASPVTAAVVAVLAGAATAALTYRVVRS